MRIVFTGPAKVEGLHLERKHLIALARDKGHEVASALDKRTDCLVLGDLNGRMTQKSLKAQARGIKVISPAEFLKQMDYS